MGIGRADALGPRSSDVGPHLRLGGCAHVHRPQPVTVCAVLSYVYRDQSTPKAVDQGASLGDRGPGRPPTRYRRVTRHTALDTLRSFSAVASKSKASSPVQTRGMTRDVLRVEIFLMHCIRKSLRKIINACNY